jgi:hypothetical protein
MFILDYGKSVMKEIGLQLFSFFSPNTAAV